MTSHTDAKADNVLPTTRPYVCAEKRRKQFALLFDCIDDLQRALRAEGEEAKEDESRKESVATGKRKRPATEATDDTLKGKALADEPPAVSSSAETARKRVREVEMEEARDDETEPGEITTKGLPSCCLFLLSA